MELILVVVTVDNTENGLSIVMTKTSKIIIGLLFVEAILTAYFFYIQPLCEPCLPGSECRLCISEQQIVIIWTGIIIATIALFYLLSINFKNTTT